MPSSLASDQLQRASRFYTLTPLSQMLESAPILLPSIGGNLDGTLPIRKSSRLVIIDNQGRLLLFRYHDEHKAPFWSTVGGELKEGESYIEAARRELQEETGFSLDIGPVLADREDTYAVARSGPARWQERYFLVQYSASGDGIDRQGWTDEERETIVGWRWWSLAEMRDQAPGTFLPEWLPDLLASQLNDARK